MINSNLSNKNKLIEEVKDEYTKLKAEGVYENQINRLLVEKYFVKALDNQISK